MATTCAESIFIDTNVLVAYSIIHAPRHAEAQRVLGEYEERGIPFWISRHVLREYIAVLTRPQSFANPLSTEDVLHSTETFEREFNVAEDGPNVTRNLRSLLRQFPCGGKQIHDANIVATMLTHGIFSLVTYNRPDFARFSPIITILPTAS